MKSQKDIKEENYKISKLMNELLKKIKRENSSLSNSTEKQ